MIASINPFSGETLRQFSPHSPTEIEHRLVHAWDAFQIQRKTPLAERAEKLRRVADLLEGEKIVLGSLITAEMGKTSLGAQAEIGKCALACRHYAENAAAGLADEVVSSGATRSFLRCDPLGPILGIMPWNFPFWQLFRFAAPALMAGNTILLKHAPNVPQCALAIEDLLLRAGFSPGVLQALLIETESVPSIVADDRIRAVTLTGSERAGRAVGALAGREIKKIVLELGGSDPFIIMPSADLDAAVATAVRSRTINDGQSCISAKRFIFVDPIYERCARQFTEQMNALRIGNPNDASTEIGPLVSPAALELLAGQVSRAVKAGARVLTGGKICSTQRCTYQPTVLADVPLDAPIGREEFFGPVALLFRARDAAEAIAIANDSPFGLGASVWTRDVGERTRFTDELEAGQVFFNAMVASDPRLPFGGVKRSGFGRELGHAGMREFVNLKTVWEQ